MPIVVLQLLIYNFGVTINEQINQITQLQLKFLFIVYIFETKYFTCFKIPQINDKVIKVSWGHYCLISKNRHSVAMRNVLKCTNCITNRDLA